MTQRINLYPQQLRPQRDRFDARGLGLMLLLLVLALGAISALQLSRVRTVEAEVTAVESQRDATGARLTALQAQLAARPDEAAREQRLRNELAAKRALLAYLAEGAFAEGAGFSGYLDGLARQVVDGVWLRRIELAAGGAHLRLDGHAVEPGRVPSLIASLGAAPAYQGRNFRRLAIDRPEDADWRVDFVLASGPEVK